MNQLTHINNQGDAQMVDISDKAVTSRIAVAQSVVMMQKTTLEMITSNKHKKGDVFAVARIAGIQAAKKCADLIPLCHPLMLTKISVELTPDLNQSSVQIIATAKLNGKTGVEMEALTAASITALTIFDMCKAVDRTMVITQTKVLEKSGGKSGDWLSK